MKIFNLILIISLILISGCTITSHVVKDNCSNETIHDLKDLPNKTVSVQAGQIQADFLDQFDFIDVKKMDEISDLIMDIKFGKSVACLLEPFVATQIKKQHPQIQILEVPLEEKDQNFGHGIGISKANAALAEEVSKIDATLKQDGTLKKFATKWGMEK